MSLQKFITSVKSKGFMNTSKYDVFLFSRTIFQEYPDISEYLNLRAASVNIPSINFNTVDDYYDVTDHRKSVYGYDKGDVTITFYVDPGARVLEMFHTWKDKIIDPKTKAIGFYSDYAKDNFLIIKTINNPERQSGDEVDVGSTISLYEVFPKSIGDISFSWEKSGVATLQVVFAFKKFMIVDSDGTDTIPVNGESDGNGNTTNGINRGIVPGVGSNPGRGLNPSNPFSTPGFNPAGSSLPGLKLPDFPIDNITDFGRFTDNPTSLQNFLANSSASLLATVPVGPLSSDVLNGFIDGQLPSTDFNPISEFADKSLVSLKTSAGAVGQKIGSIRTAVDLTANISKTLDIVAQDIPFESNIIDIDNITTIFDGVDLSTVDIQTANDIIDTKLTSSLGTVFQEVDNFVTGESGEKSLKELVDSVALTTGNFGNLSINDGEAGHKLGLDEISASLFGISNTLPSINDDESVFALNMSRIQSAKMLIEEKTASLSNYESGLITDKTGIKKQVNSGYEILGNVKIATTDVGKVVDSIRSLKQQASIKNIRNVVLSVDGIEKSTKNVIKGGIKVVNSILGFFN